MCNLNTPMAFMLLRSFIYLVHLKKMWYNMQREKLGYIYT